ncbi:MAG TPA: cellulase family glycosylhydrolase [Anaerolineae bacterium]|nr:cellulase family glycosylhydrolase [Anaerolineae bacterium]
MSDIKQTVLPRWRGFNLLELFTTRNDGNFREDDFRWMRDWGFNFARIPACYLLWIEDGDPYKLHEPMLEKVDRVLRLGQQYGIHIDLNFHRGPGYSVNGERDEPFNLWKDRAALDAFCFHWETFARRYQGIPSEQLSFNLINEPKNPTPDFMTREDHARVIRAAVAAIRAVDPERLILIDGLTWGNDPCPELADLGVAQSCRAYIPMGVSHYKAGWVDSGGLPEPTWPGALHGGEPWDRARLEAHYRQWADLAAQGVGVHCGEGGAFNQTPHAVVLAWLRDVLDILTGYNIGYALWNFRGAFGILDSGRADVAYEDWRGHKLDRALLTLLQEF